MDTLQKIVVGVETEEELLNIYEKAKEKNILVERIALLDPSKHDLAHITQWLRRRANEEAKLNAEAEILKEGQSEFIVAFTSDEDKKEKVTLKGRDAREIRRKFGDLFVGCKLLTIRPK